MRHFCTYFDIRYLSRALVLYRSLERYCPSFTLWMLCMDDEAHAALKTLALPSVRPISLGEFEDGDTALVSVKKDRTVIEYYFTSTPSLPRFIFRASEEPDMITYLDADMCFFSDPELLFDEIGGASIALIEHRFPPALKDRERAGRFNVGWVSFRRDATGLAAIEWWRERCLEWCYDRVEDGRCADQKYLDDWPKRFGNVCVVSHKGANLAPWNIANYKLGVDNGTVIVDGEPLVFCHYHGLKHIAGSLYDVGLGSYKVKMSRFMRERLYLPYVQKLVEAEESLADVAAVHQDRGTLRGTIAGGKDPLKRLYHLLFRVILPRNYLRVPHRIGTKPSAS